jgi:hypothetical protein
MFVHVIAMHVGRWPFASNRHGRGADGGMAAARSMPVRMIGVVELGAIGHGGTFEPRGEG